MDSRRPARPARQIPARTAGPKVDDPFRSKPYYPRTSNTFARRPAASYREVCGARSKKSLSVGAGPARWWRIDEDKGKSAQSPRGTCRHPRRFVASFHTCVKNRRRPEHNASDVHGDAPLSHQRESRPPFRSPAARNRQSASSPPDRKLRPRNPGLIPKPPAIALKELLDPHLPQRWPDIAGW